MQKFVIKSTEGIHAKLASEIVQASQKYTSEIKLVYSKITVDAKSILGLMSLGIPSGDNVELIIYGKDEKEAMEEIKKVIEK
jgi:phosphocarrier protein